jgi:hypothetical protein
MEIHMGKALGTFSKATIALIVLFGISSGALAATRQQTPRPPRPKKPRAGALGEDEFSLFSGRPIEPHHWRYL